MQRSRTRTRRQVAARRHRTVGCMAAVASLDQGVLEAVEGLVAPAAAVVPMVWAMWAMAAGSSAEVGLVAAVEEGFR